MSDPAPMVLEMLDAGIASARSEGVAALERVQWQVASGEFWVVGSRPGAGKTALLQTAAGIQRPAAGAMRLFGRPLADLAEAELLALRLRLSLVFEGGGRLFQPLTVGENVALPYCYHRDCAWEGAAEKLAAVLEFTGLAAWASWAPNRLPRALGPRAGLARALMMDPEALLLDNPLRGLEAGEQAWWLDALARLGRGAPVTQARPLTLIVAVEDLRPWIGLGSHFALLQGRRLVGLGGSETAQKNPAAWEHDLLARPAGTG